MKITVSTKSNVQVGPTAKYMLRAISDAISEVVFNAAQPIQEEAKAVVHVDTGRLQGSIHTEMLSADQNRATAGVGPDASVPYAARLEFGFVGVDSLGRHYNQPPYPYMRPAFDAKSTESTDIIKSSLREAITDSLVDATNAVAAARNQRNSGG